MSLCLFCNGPDKSYKPPPGKVFICGSCVILLADAGQDDLKKAHAKAIKFGLNNKAFAIESFLIKEIDGEQQKPPIRKYERHPNRKRVDRPVRNKKIYTKRVKI